MTEYYEDDDLEDEEDYDDGIYEDDDGRQYEVENGTIYELADEDDEYDDLDAEAEQVREELLASAALLEDKLDHPLTNREAERILDRWEESGELPHEADGVTADLDDRDQRRQYMADQMREGGSTEHTLKPEGGE